MPEPDIDADVARRNQRDTATMGLISGFQPSEKLGTRILITAEEAYPALERAFLDARIEIWASFRIFDLSTRLRSREAMHVGETWFDLLVHVLKRGVAMRMVLTDFDPVVRPRMHRKAWAAARYFYAAAEVAGPGADLDIATAMHPARTGLIPRLAVWPAVQNRMKKNAKWLNEMEPGTRDACLRDLPGLVPYLTRLPDGRVAPRRGVVPDLHPTTHHQKLAVFDRRLLYIGGLDLNERRFDTQRHEKAGEDTWADVQLLTDGPAVSEAQAHLESFPAVVAGLRPPPPQKRLVRTLSRRRTDSTLFFGPEPIANEVLLAHEKFCQEAQSLIYLETQFLRDRRFARMLARAGRANRKLGLIVMLPAAPEDVAFEGSGATDARFGEFLQWRCLKILQSAFRERLFVGAGAQPRRARGPGTPSRRDRLLGAELVYIHSKVSIFDDRAALVSSANLNGRSLRWDTEAGVVLDGPGEVRALRRRMFVHWLPRDAGETFFDDATAVGAWRDLALSNARRAPEKRKGFLLPYDLKASARYGVYLPGIPEEMV